MTPEHLSSVIYDNIVDGHLAEYKAILENELPNRAISYWKNLHNMYKLMSNEQKELIISVMKQVSVDAVSQLLSIVDGVAAVDGIDGEFILTYDGQRIPGNLQECFLMKAQSSL